MHSNVRCCRVEQMAYVHLYLGTLGPPLESDARDKHKMKACVVAKKLKEGLYHGCEVLPAAFSGVSLRFVHTAWQTHPARDVSSSPLVRASCWSRYTRRSFSCS